MSARNLSGPVWTPAADETLRRLAGERQSASQIAKVIPVSRNAIIGRARRLGVPLNGSAAGKTGPHAPRWTSADIEKAAVMLRAGVTRAQLGAAFGMTPAGVEARVYRNPTLKQIGFRAEAKPSMSARTGLVIRPKKVAEVATRKVVETLKEYRPVDARAFDEASRRLTLADLEWSDCRWPVHGEKADTLFCGLPHVEGSRYCRDHFRRSVANAPFLARAA